MSNRREKILNETSYWVEGVNMELYDALVSFMERNQLNQTEFSKFLGISKGRLSQILNDGEINFSLEKLFEIALKIDKFPQLTFVDKAEYLKTTEEQSRSYEGFYKETIVLQTLNLYDCFQTNDKKSTRLKSQNDFKKELTIV